MKRFIRHPYFAIFLVNIFFFLCLEGVARILAYRGLIPYNHYPTSRERKILDDISPDFGVWRHPNRSVRHATACFDVEYNSNNYGMRDKDRSFKKGQSPRVVVLGDSFAEGYGVEERERFTNIVEGKSGAEILNFGISGDFGSVQEYLLYKNLASQFEHDAVAIFFLPANDFSDNDLTDFEPSRYRPYLRARDDGDFEVYYPISFEARKKLQPISVSRAMRREIYNHSYLLNAFRQVGDIFEESFKDNVTRQMKKTSYENYSEADFKKLIWSYEKIAEASNPRPLHIFIIPREVDFIQAQDEDAPSKLTEDLKLFAKAHSNVQVHDLLPLFRAEISARNITHDETFLPCDDHWSPLGHEMVAKFFQKALQLELK